MSEIKILVYKIDIDYLEQNNDELLEGLYPARRESVEKLKSKKAAFTSMAAGLLLMTAYKVAVGASGKDIVIKKGEYGKPYIEGEKRFKYNISHSGDYVVLVYTTDKDVSSLGIDVEVIRKRDDDMRVANRFFTRQEIDYISDGLTCSDIDSRFYKVWTMKEAYIKMNGNGLSQRLDEFSVNPDELSVEDTHKSESEEHICYDMKIYDRHVISVCVSGMPDAEFIYEQITLDKHFLMR